MKIKRPTPELYLSLPKAIAVLRNRISATEREIACWLFFDQIKAYGHVHDLIDPPEISLMGIALTDWAQASKESPPYVKALQGAYFLVSDIENLTPPARYISFGELIHRWSAQCKTEDAAIAFILSRIAQDRLHDFAPGLGPTTLNQTHFTTNIPLPPAEWAMFFMAEVEAIEASDFPEMIMAPQTQPIQSVEPPRTDKKTQRNKQRRQELAIVEEVRKLGYDPKAIPIARNGYKGIKSEVREQFTIPSELFGTIKTFESAWERARSYGDIKDAVNHPPSIK